MGRTKWLFRIIFTLAFAAAANCCIFAAERPLLWIPAVVLFAVVNLFAGFTDRTIPGVRLKLLSHGTETLFIFLSSCVMSIAAQIAVLIRHQSDSRLCLLSILVCVIAHFLLFWNGIISVYCTSVQLGIKLRVIGLLCGLIPIANIIALVSIIRVTSREVRFETEKIHLNRSRKDDMICATKYPILLVHGVFFRDRKLFNYWGRIPAQLQLNGARVHYGNHQSARAIPDSAAELAERIKSLVEKTGCEKLNIIAHSKGGLDCRYAIDKLGCGPYVASLTTVSSPHRGCEFADYLLEKIPEKVQEKVARAYNTAAFELGDMEPDFMAAVRDLSASGCRTLFEGMEQPEGIYCQSVGSVIKHMSHGKFPTNLAHCLIKRFEGANDGLVSETSFPWGDKYTLLTVEGDRGISHGDTIDLNRENIPGFDVREFYVQLVSDLKKRGL